MSANSSLNKPNLAKPSPAKPSLTLKRRLNAPPKKVYEAWTDPEKIARWWGPENVNTIHRVQTDARIGGRFQVDFSSDDGEEHSISGVYREIAPNEKLVFTWSWRSTPERESLVTVTIRPDGDGATMLTLLHEHLFDEKARAGHLHGWSGSLNKLEALFAR